MRKSTIGLLLAAGAAMTAGCSATIGYHNPKPEHEAAGTSTFVATAPRTVTLLNNAGETIGSAVLAQGRTGLLITVEANGLTPGWHGIHLHAVGVCESNFTSAGGHINHGASPYPHGLLNPQGPDYGDLPNIHADASGKAVAQLFTTRARITPEGQGEYLGDADGSAIIIHASADDHSSQPIGGAGARVACGIISAD